MNEQNIFFYAKLMFKIWQDPYYLQRKLYKLIQYEIYLNISIWHQSLFAMYNIHDR